MKDKKYLTCKYLDAGMDGMLCDLLGGMPCKLLRDKKCTDYTAKGKKKVLKEKQIEEMAKEYKEWAVNLLKVRFDLKPEAFDIHHKNNYSFENCADCLWNKIKGSMEELLWLRENQHPEDSVVITKTEYQDLKERANKKINGLELKIGGASGWFPIEFIKGAIERDLDHDRIVFSREEFENNLTLSMGYKIGSKETAEKFYQSFIDELMRGCGDDKEFWVVKLINKKAQEFDVEIKEGEQ